jgi:hypothetical protein
MRSGWARGFRERHTADAGTGKGIRAQNPSPSSNGQSPPLFIVLAYGPPSVRPKRLPAPKEIAWFATWGTFRQIPPRGRIHANCEHTRGRGDHRPNLPGEEGSNTPGAKVPAARWTDMANSRPRAVRREGSVRRGNEVPFRAGDYFTTTSAARKASKVTEGPPKWIWAICSGDSVPE